MTSPSEKDQATPSTDLEVRVNWLRTELENVRAEAQRAELEAQRAVQSRQVGPLDEWVNVLKDYDTLAQTLARTEFVPKEFRGKPDSITAGLMFGREIGIPPVTMMQNMVVVHGRVTMYAEHLRSMVLAAGHEFAIDETNSDRCVVSGRRKGSDRWQTFTYTMDQAKLAGLYAQNEQYRKRPTEMLLARATSVMCHAMFPDAIRGMQALEEIELGEPDAPPTAPVVESRGTVQRKAKPKAAVAIEPAKPTVPPTAPDQPALPPLPGEAEPPTSITDPPKRRTETEVLSGAGSAGTSGEGPASAPEDIPSEPTDPTQRQCPNISNGEQCRYAAGHVDRGVPHTYGGGLKDPVSYKRCGIADQHDAHAFTEGKTVYACHGTALETRATVDDTPVPAVQETELPAGEMQVRHCPDYDNSHDKHIWQLDGDDVSYLCSGMVHQDVKGLADRRRGLEAENDAAAWSGAVPSAPKPMSAAQTKLLQSRFRALGYTDDPGDREARLAIAAVLSGRAEVTTFRAGTAESMSSAEASRVIDGLADCRNRDDVLELMVKAKQDADAEETQG